MNNKIASLCLLAYKRPEKLRMCLNSLLETVDYPCEIIVNLDGVDFENRLTLVDYLNQEKISKLILNNGENRGIGHSFQNCIAVSEGKYIFKIDTDIVFKPHWLSTSIKILDNNPDIGALSQFNYNHYDSKDFRFRIQRERTDCFTVSDFVSSIYCFRRIDLSKISKVKDDGNHTKLGTLAITKEDFVTTKFGYGESVYVYLDENGVGQVMGKTEEPLLF